MARDAWCPVQGSHGDLGAAPLLAHLTAAQIAQHAAAHVAQQQRGSAFAPVRQQSDTPASIQAAASLAVRTDHDALCRSLPTFTVDGAVL